ncbi:autotransporter domain-containing protein, partial [Saccharibacter sp. 17.LH.SD]|uniref:autotransporter outer membrane beta-barrel domain-containing protein n=1 Tax=Saccharibacter sp. 17.LH.SD TaxID=2689393 RepID=UPI00136EA3F5
STDGGTASTDQLLSAKTGTVTVNTGGTLSASDVRDAQGHVQTNAITVASNERNAELNLNGGTLQRNTYNDTATSKSDLTSAVNINLSKTSTVDTNNGQVVLEGQVAGSGGLTKESAGGLILTGHNSYQGDTTVNNGYVQLGNNNGLTGDLGQSKNVHLTNADSGLVVDRGNALTLGQTISGAGSLTQNGTGTTTLTGTNSYTGDTTVNHGTLQLGANNGLTGDLGQSKALHLTNADSGLVVDRGNALTLGQTISGAGSLTQNGTGTTTLTGTNNYTGATTVDRGTLQLGSNNGLTGDLGQSSALHLANADGGLVVDRGNALTLGQTISGAGSLTQNGTGTTTLTGTNSYAGDTTVNHGTLQLGANNGLTGDLGQSQNVHLTNADSGLVVDRGNTLTLGQTISGKGSLTQNGTGKTILTGTNSYAGDTTVNHGTLQLGANNGLTGDLGQSQNVHLTNADSGLVVDRGNTLALDQTISGKGSLIQNGKGTTILTGTNSYTGATTVNNGTLQLGSNNGSTGDIGQSRGVYLNGNDSNLTVNRSNALTLAQEIAGTGSFTQLGTGTTTFTGDNSYTGATNIEHGTLSVNGNQSLATGQTTVYNGATLSGNGTLGGAVTVQNGGIISAGNGESNGKLTIAGTNNPQGTNLVVQSGGIVNANLGAAAQSGDRVAPAGYTYHEGSVIYVTGKASFGSGSVINLATNTGVSLRYNLPYRVVQTTGGIEGDLSKVEAKQNYIFLKPQITSENTTGFGPTLSPNNQADGNALDVVLRRNGVSYSSVGETRNEVNTGLALDTVGDTSNVAQAMAQIQDRGQARQALNSLSGEVHASVRTALIEDSYYTRQAVFDRLMTAECDGIADGARTRVRDSRTGQWVDARCVTDRTEWWGQAFGGQGHNDSTSGGTAGLNHSTAGFLMGADRMIVDNWRVGGFAGYTHSMMNVGSRSSSGNSDNVTFGAYAGKHWGAIHLRTGLSYTWNSINTTRHVGFVGYSDRLHDHQIGGTGQLFAELGYRFRVGEWTRIEPFVGMTYVNLHTNGYREHGGDAALRGRGTDNSVGFSTFGVRMATRLRVGDTIVSPYGMVAYRRAFGNTSPSVHQSFVSGSNDMDINGAPLAHDTALFDAGVQAKLTDMIDLRLSYTGQYAGHAYDNGGRASIRMRF